MVGMHKSTAKKLSMDNLTMESDWSKLCTWCYTNPKKENFIFAEIGIWCYTSIPKKEIVNSGQNYNLILARIEFV